MDGAARERLTNDRLGPIDLGLVAIVEEEHADGNAIFRLQIFGLIELEPLGFFAKEQLRNLASEPRPVAGITTNAAAMFESFERGQCPFDNFGGSSAVFRRDATNAAGVFAHVVRVKELPRAESSALFKDGGVPPHSKNYFSLHCRPRASSAQALR